MNSSSVGPFNNTYNFLFHPIQSAPAERSKGIRVFASIAIGILTLGASHIAIGLIHKGPEWGSKFKAYLTGNQAKTAYIINDVASKTLMLNKNLMLERVKELQESSQRAKMVRGPLLVEELATWIKKLEKFEEGLTKSLPIKDGLSYDDKLRYDFLQNAIKATKDNLINLQSKEKEKEKVKYDIHLEFLRVDTSMNYLITMVNLLSPHKTEN